MRKTLSLFIVGLLLFCSVVAFGQGIVTGSISGVVQDAHKAVVAGAKITATETSTGLDFSTVANEVGFFTIRSAAIGTYTVTVQAAGFEKLTITKVVVSVGKDTALGVQTLSVGGTAEVITVEGNVPLVDTQGAQITSSVEAGRITSMPIGNGLDSLALFTPGVVSTGQGRFGNTNGANLSANGQRSRSNNFQIDGQANNDPSVTGPSIFLGNQEVIAEMQVVTNFGAEYGRNTGAVVNYVTKSGTNAFHGTAFENYFPSTFNSMGNSGKTPLLGFCAKGQDPKATGCTVPKVARDIDNRFGGTLGGPILKNKAWFFGSYYEERERVGASPSTTLLFTPTPNGIQTLLNTFPNSPAIPYIKNILPGSINIGSPTFSNLTMKTVTANGVSVPVEFGNISRFVPSVYNDREVTGRGDYQLSQNDFIFGRYVYQKNISTVAGGSITRGAWVDVPGIDQQVGLDWRHTFSPNVTNQARYSYSRANFGFDHGSFSDCTQIDMTKCPTVIAFRDSTLQGMGLDNTYPQGRVINNSQVQDNATWVFGRHMFKFGGEFDRQRAPGVFLPNYNGSFSFTDWDTFLSGKPNNLSLVDGPSKARFVENDYAVYFQDDFRFRPNLTLNVGVRWEMYGNSINVLHDQTVARQTGASPMWLATLPLSQTTVPHVPADTNNFGPVVGFSYTPRFAKSIFGEDKTVFRGGFRIAYDAPYQNIYSNVYGSTPTVNASTMYMANDGKTKAPTGATIVNGINLGAGFTGADVRTANLGFMPLGVDPGTRDQTTVAKNFHTAYSEQWNAGIQRYVTKTSAFEVRYVGSHSIGLYQSYIGNPYLKYFVDNNHPEWIPQNLTMCADKTAAGYGFADCSRKTVFERGNTGWSRYDALQTRFDIQNWHGVTANAGYTYSRNLDNSSEVFNAAGVGMLAFNQNPFNPNYRTDAGTSAINFPNVFTLSFTYELPWMKDQHGFFGRLAGGWQFNTTYRYSSGEPYTMVERRQNSDIPGFCDPASQLGNDPCRPIISNTKAPFNSVASIVVDPTTSQFAVVDMYTYAITGGCKYGTDPAKCRAAYVTGGNVADLLKNFYWVVNNPAAANFFGKAPWELGMPRNSLRGDTLNNANMSAYKNFRINERFKAQLNATAFNVFNRMYLGVPDNNFGDIGLGPLWARSAGLRQFGTNKYNGSGAGVVNRTQDGIGIRALTLGAKVTF